MAPSDVVRAEGLTSHPAWYKCFVPKALGNPGPTLAPAPPLGTTDAWNNVPSNYNYDPDFLLAQRLRMKPLGTALGTLPLWLMAGARVSINESTDTDFASNPDQYDYDLSRELQLPRPHPPFTNRLRIEYGSNRYDHNSIPGVTPWLDARWKLVNPRLFSPHGAIEFNSLPPSFKDTKEMEEVLRCFELAFETHAAEELRHFRWLQWVSETNPYNVLTHPGDTEAAEHRLSGAPRFCYQTDFPRSLPSLGYYYWHKPRQGVLNDTDADNGNLTSALRDWKSQVFYMPADTVVPRHYARPLKITREASHIGISGSGDDDPRYYAKINNRLALQREWCYQPDKPESWLTRRGPFAWVFVYWAHGSEFNDERVSAYNDNRYRIGKFLKTKQPVGIAPEYFRHDLVQAHRQASLAAPPPSYSEKKFTPPSRWDLQWTNSHAEWDSYEDELFTRPHERFRGCRRWSEKRAEIYRGYREIANSKRNWFIVGDPGLAPARVAGGPLPASNEPVRSLKRFPYALPRVPLNFSDEPEGLTAARHRMTPGGKYFSNRTRHFDWTFDEPRWQWFIANDTSKICLRVPMLFHDHYNGADWKDFDCEWETRYRKPPNKTGESAKSKMKPWRPIDKFYWQRSWARQLRVLRRPEPLPDSIRNNKAHALDRVQCAHLVDLAQMLPTDDEPWYHDDNTVKTEWKHEDHWNWRDKARYRRVMPNRDPNRDPVEISHRVDDWQVCFPLDQYRRLIVEVIPVVGGRAEDILSDSGLPSMTDSGLAPESLVVHTYRRTRAWSPYLKEKREMTAAMGNLLIINHLGVLRGNMLELGELKKELEKIKKSVPGGDEKSTGNGDTKVTIEAEANKDRKKPKKPKKNAPPDGGREPESPPDSPPPPAYTPLPEEPYRPLMPPGAGNSPRNTTWEPGAQTQMTSPGGGLLPRDSPLGRSGEPRGTTLGSPGVQPSGGFAPDVGGSQMVDDQPYSRGLGTTAEAPVDYMGGDVSPTGYGRVRSPSSEIMGDQDEYGHPLLGSPGTDYDEIGDRSSVMDPNFGGAMGEDIDGQSLSGSMVSSLNSQDRVQDLDGADSLGSGQRTESQATHTSLDSQGTPRSESGAAIADQSSVGTGTGTGSRGSQSPGAVPSSATGATTASVGSVDGGGIAGSEAGRASNIPPSGSSASLGGSRAGTATPVHGSDISLSEGASGADTESARGANSAVDASSAHGSSDDSGVTPRGADKASDLVSGGEEDDLRPSSDDASRSGQGDREAGSSEGLDTEVEDEEKATVGGSGDSALGASQGSELSSNSQVKAASGSDSLGSQEVRSVGSQDDSDIVVATPQSSVESGDDADDRAVPSMARTLASSGTMDPNDRITKWIKGVDPSGDPNVTDSDAEGLSRKVRDSGDVSDNGSDLAGSAPSASDKDLVDSDLSVSSEGVARTPKRPSNDDDDDATLSDIEPSEDAYGSALDDAAKSRRTKLASIGERSDPFAVSPAGDSHRTLTRDIAAPESDDEQDAMIIDEDGIPVVDRQIPLTSLQEYLATVPDPEWLAPRNSLEDLTADKLESIPNSDQEKAIDEFKSLLDIVGEHFEDPADEVRRSDEITDEEWLRCVTWWDCDSTQEFGLLMNILSKPELKILTKSPTERRMNDIDIASNTDPDLPSHDERTLIDRPDIDERYIDESTLGPGSVMRFGNLQRQVDASLDDAQSSDATTLRRFNDLQRQVNAGNDDTEGTSDTSIRRLDSLQRQVDAGADDGQGASAASFRRFESLQREVDASMNETMTSKAASVRRLDKLQREVDAGLNNTASADASVRRLSNLQREVNAGPGTSRRTQRDSYTRFKELQRQVSADLETAGSGSRDSYSRLREIQRQLDAGPESTLRDLHPPDSSDIIEVREVLAPRSAASFSKNHARGQDDRFRTPVARTKPSLKHSREDTARGSGTLPSPQRASSMSTESEWTESGMTESGTEATGSDEAQQLGRGSRSSRGGRSGAANKRGSGQGSGSDIDRTVKHMNDLGSGQFEVRMHDGDLHFHGGQDSNVTSNDWTSGMRGGEDLDDIGSPSQQDSDLTSQSDKLSDVDNEPKNLENRRIDMQQAHVNLLKALWILTEWLHDRLELPPKPYTVPLSTGQALLARVEDRIRWMYLHGLLPTSDISIQDFDLTIWIPYPDVNASPELAKVLDGRDQDFDADAPHRAKVDHLDQPPLQNPGSLQIFVAVKVLQNGCTLLTEDGSEMSLPCIFSIMRDTEHYRTSLAIWSQWNLINIRARPDDDHLDDMDWHVWNEFSWLPDHSTARIRLSPTFTLSLQFEKSDYRYVRHLVDQTPALDHAFQPRANEQVVLTTQLVAGQYQPEGQNGLRFPNGMIRDCHLLIFERQRVKEIGVVPVELHRGYRVALVSLQLATHDIFAVSFGFRKGAPLVYEKFEQDVDKAAPTIDYNLPQSDRGLKQANLNPPEEIHADEPQTESESFSQDGITESERQESHTSSEQSETDRSVSEADGLTTSEETKRSATRASDESDNEAATSQSDSDATSVTVSAAFRRRAVLGGEDGDRSNATLTDGTEDDSVWEDETADRSRDRATDKPGNGHQSKTITPDSMHRSQERISPVDRYAIRLYILPSAGQRKWMFFQFNGESSYRKFSTFFSGMAKREDEQQLPNPIQLVSYSIETANQILAKERSHFLWPRQPDKPISQEDGRVTFINRIVQTTPQMPMTLLSDKLRMVMTNFDGGAFVDRLMLEPGELLLRLPASRESRLSVLRKPQSEYSTMINVNSMLTNPLDVRFAISEVVRRDPTLRRYEFHNLDDMHMFQRAITGHQVRFDAMAPQMTICNSKASKRVIPRLLNRNRDDIATRVRIQVVVDQNDASFEAVIAEAPTPLTPLEGEDPALTMQPVIERPAFVKILCFFNDFDYADALVLHVKASDTAYAQEIDKSGYRSVKLLGAQFKQPKKEADELVEPTQEPRFNAQSAYSAEGATTPSTVLTDADTDANNAANGADDKDATGGGGVDLNGADGKKIAPAIGDDDDPWSSQSSVLPLIRRRYVNMDGRKDLDDSKDIEIHFFDERDFRNFCHALPAQPDPAPGALVGFLGLPTATGGASGNYDRNGTPGGANAGERAAKRRSARRPIWRMSRGPDVDDYY